MNIWKIIACEAISKSCEIERNMLLQKTCRLLRQNHRQKLMLMLLMIFTGKYAILRFFHYGLDIHTKFSGIWFLLSFLLFLSVFFMDIQLFEIKNRLLVLQSPEDNSIGT